MRSKSVLVLSLCVACMLMLCGAAQAAEGIVDTKALVLRKSASTAGKVIHTLGKGDKLDILSVQDDWYRVRFGKYTGYVMAKYVDVKGELPREEASSDDSSDASSAASSEASSNAAGSSSTLRPGHSGSAVKALQARLKELGYYTLSTDGVYGAGTTAAVKAFQKAEKLTADGVAGPKTLRALEDAEKTESTPEEEETEASSATLRAGSKGSAVKALQKQLKELGYYTRSLDGVYGSGTIAAVKAFQKKAGLTQDGVAGPRTLQALEKADSSLSAEPAIKTESLEWFKNGNSAIPRGAVFTVKDVLTGKTFQVKRWAGSSHADCEPLTGNDTAIMKSVYGGSWSWDRRAILVQYNGHVYAASMNGMPHGTTTLSNGFNGHFCIHFTGSKTHGSDKVDPDHQAAVKKALQAAW